LKDQLCGLIDRVPMRGGDESASCLERFSAKVSVKNIEYSQVGRDIFQQSVEALFGGDSLHITYHYPHTDTTSERTIHPLHLMHYMGSWHLTAWCSARLGLRDFALSRIRGISPVARNIDVPDDLPELKEYTRKHFGIMQGNTTIEVGLRFSAKIASWVSEQIWHPQQGSTHNPDNSLTLNFPVADFRELTKTILSHGADIEVLHPPEPKLLVKEEIDRMTKIYW
jgi:predicted DNA-binding transcriptional regulator YafY